MLIWGKPTVLSASDGDLLEDGVARGDSSQCCQSECVLHFDGREGREKLEEVKEGMILDGEQKDTLRRTHHRYICS
jgi:hypothetical protein